MAFSPQPDLPKIIPALLLVDTAGQPDNPTARALQIPAYRVTTIEGLAAALAAVKAGHFDLVVLDTEQPGPSALQFLSDLNAYDPTLPSVLVTDSGTVTMAIEAMKRGAQGFVIKPFKAAELHESVQNALAQARMVRENLQMQFYTPMLESLSAALLQVVDAGDYSAGSNSRQVAGLCKALAEAMGLPDELVSQIYLAGLFHDIGKIGVADAILQKQGPLDDREQAELARYPDLGARIIGQAPGMDTAARIIRHQADYFNGRGRPDGLAGDQIPLGSRILAVALAWSEFIKVNNSTALALKKEEFKESLRQAQGTQFDPAVIEVALQLIEEEEKAKVAE